MRIKWLPSLHDPGPVRLWRIQYALAACFAVALAGLAVLWVVALVLLHHPSLPRSNVISVHDSVGVAQLVFASVAGAGALVALVVAYRRQRVAEVATVVDKDRWEVEKERWEATAASDRLRAFNERFTSIAAQLGHSDPAVRLAGVHAMAGLADDWEENRQTCVDVLCAYLRLPYGPDPGKAATQDRTDYLANREVRHTIIRLIGTHLHTDADARWSWEGLNFDFTGVIFDGGSFAGAQFSRPGIVRFDGASFPVGEVSFAWAKFSGGQVSFNEAEFSGGQVRFDDAEFSSNVLFDGAKFSDGQISFNEAEFSDGQVSFDHAEFSGGQVSFDLAEFSGGQVRFDLAEFSGCEISFDEAGFSRGQVRFGGAEFFGGQVSFDRAVFSGCQVHFGGAKFSDSQVSFDHAKFSGGQVRFDSTMFSGGQVSFDAAEFSGGQVRFDLANFSGGQVSFADAADWSHPPKFGWEKPPAGVTLPAGAQIDPHVASPE